MILTEAKKRLKSIDALFQNCFETKFSFAYYRLPNVSNANLLIGKTEILEKLIDFSTCGKGFVIAPFENKDSCFLKIEKAFYGIDPKNPFLEMEGDDIGSKKQNTFELLKVNLPSSEKETYLKTISSVIEKIKNSPLKKVVISRKKKIGDLNGDAYSLGFKKLCEGYPNAFISMVFLADINQIWIGASPEILVSENKDGIFKTVALAGTQSAFDINNKEIRSIDALWSHKEIEEQALVSRYIINCLKKIRVREYEEEGPKTIKAGNLLHLNSTYIIDSKTINFSNLSTVMLDLLHPTSAVCGMPKELAEEAISQAENYDRELYSGYLGPVNIENESHLFVNLRTLKIENYEVFAYAGGGITEDSDPEKEWQETELKLATIQKVFS
jgi:isochorismate synthase